MWVDCWPSIITLTWILVFKSGLHGVHPWNQEVSGRYCTWPSSYNCLTFGVCRAYNEAMRVPYPCHSLGKRLEATEANASDYVMSLRLEILKFAYSANNRKCRRLGSNMAESRDAIDPSNKQLFQSFHSL
jgi:hypothetical protein